MSEVTCGTQMVFVEREYLPWVWSHAMPVLLTAQDWYSKYESEADLLHRLLSETSHLWVIGTTKDATDVRCVVITEWLDFPRNRTLRIKLFCARELGDYVDRHLSTIEEWGIRNGATRFQVFGREAWKRLLASRGYTHEALILGKPAAKGEA